MNPSGLSAEDEMHWGLTDEQIAARAAGIGGSEARIAVHGTAEERYELWRLKIGEVRPKKIMSDWANALRHVTEKLQMDWYEHVHDGSQVMRRGVSLVHPEYKFMRCTLDGFVEPQGVPINAKHVSRWTKEAREWCIEHYTPQVTHEATVAGADYGLLSLLHGEKEPEIIRIDVDVFYQVDMVEREADFWRCVEERVPPADCAELDIPKVARTVARLRTLDASMATVGSEDWQNLVARNNWLPDAFNHASTFAETEGAFKAHQAARTEIGKLLPEDIGSVLLPTNRGTFSAKRNAAGAITMKVEK